MKNVLLILLSIVLSNSIFAQNKDYYDLEPKHTLRISKEYNKFPVIYKVNNKEFVFSTKPKSKKVLNKKYALLSEQINDLEAQNAKRTSLYEGKIKKFKEVSKIKTLINTFLNSKMPYEIKKKNLIEAQTLASNHGVNELIYADSNINSSLKNKFFVLQLNKLDLKVHLKKVTWRLEKMDLVKPVESPSNLLEENLKELQLKKSRLRKYDLIASKPKITKKQGLVIGASSVPLKQVSGQFVKKGVYFIIKNNYKSLFKKGMLVSVSDVRKYNLEQKGYVGSAKELIVDTNTQHLYISEKTFLNKYAFSINGKYNANNKTLLSMNTFKLPM